MQLSIGLKPQRSQISRLTSSNNICVSNKHAIPFGKHKKERQQSSIVTRVHAINWLYDWLARWVRLLLVPGAKVEGFPTHWKSIKLQPKTGSNLKLAAVCLRCIPPPPTQAACQVLSDFANWVSVVKTLFENQFPWKLETNLAHLAQSRAVRGKVELPEPSATLLRQTPFAWSKLPRVGFFFCNGCCLWFTGLLRESATTIVFNTRLCLSIVQLNARVNVDSSSANALNSASDRYPSISYFGKTEKIEFYNLMHSTNWTDTYMTV